MYEAAAHHLLNELLDELKPEIRRADLRHFYTRLGANFYAIHSLFRTLYGSHPDFHQQLRRLVEVMATRTIERSADFERQDRQRERDRDWFLRPNLAAMALYADGFAGTLNGVRERLGYLQSLGVNVVHIMPMLDGPEGANDGGYAVSDYRRINPRLGTLDDFRSLTTAMRARGMVLIADIVVNHTSDQHEWALRAKAGEKRFQDYFYLFPNRDIPDLFDETLPEIFPETSPGNFTFIPEINQWAMTVFNDYQWDLNYSNPAVFVEMIDIALFWANEGVDILRLDAVAFLWKKIGTNCQNLHEAHLILQLMKDCCQVVAPGVLFIAEAIVAPVEIIKYFGEDAVVAKECEIAYNATFMALLWDAMATRNARLLNQGIQSLPNKLDGATWLNYARCHDDIGLGFDDADIAAVGYDPKAHRRFLLDYYTGQFSGSDARGALFGANPRTGDARISGSLASLAGLEAALERDDAHEIEHAIHRIALLHGMIASFGGIPLLYYGDELGLRSDRRYLDDPAKANDSRWSNRPTFDWSIAARSEQHGTIEHRVFTALQRILAVRSSIAAFADFNNRELINTDNPHLFTFIRHAVDGLHPPVLVIANFDAKPQWLDLKPLPQRRSLLAGALQDLHSGETPRLFDDRLAIPPYRFYWLAPCR